MMSSSSLKQKYIDIENQVIEEKESEEESEEDAEDIFENLKNENKLMKEYIFEKYLEEYKFMQSSKKRMKIREYLIVICILMMICGVVFSFV
jgi:t-SNARE complex subunit (syntaxin)